MCGYENEHDTERDQKGWPRTLLPDACHLPADGSFPERPRIFKGRRPAGLVGQLHSEMRGILSLGMNARRKKNRPHAVRWRLKKLTGIKPHWKLWPTNEKPIS